MTLKILVPTGILIHQDAARITAEAPNGWFTLLPRHIDFVAALVPGILSFQPSEGPETFVALDEAVLVKRGAEVLVSARTGVYGLALDDLRRLLEERSHTVTGHDKVVRSAAARLEAALVRRFMEMQEYGG
jgi:F-type H+-transporting ATPase subunit epsilon